MENVEIVGVSTKTVEQTGNIIAIDLEKCTGANECLVMAIDNNDNKQPQEDGTLALNEVECANATENMTNIEIAAETNASSGADVEKVRDSFEEFTAVIAKDEQTAVQKNESSDAVTLAENQQNDVMETNTNKDAATIQTNESSDAVTSAENQQNDVMEIDTDAAATTETETNAATTTTEFEISQISKDKSPIKSDNVSITKPVGSLGLLVQYVSSSDDDDEDEESSGDSAQAKDLFDKVMSKGEYRVADDGEGSDETESDYDDSDVECVGEVSPETIDITNENDLKAFMDSCDDNGAPKGPIKAKGEFGIEDLPPIADLTITVPESECIQLGTISGVVGTLVLVESLPNFAAVDIDTVLFLEKGNRTLGQVFDVMGNVASPIYCVRFNKAEDIVDKKITVGATVYVAPKTEHTNFIVLSELMNHKGTDASWEDDIEPPTGCGDFSDDEEERVARRSRNQQQRNRNRTSISSDIGDGPLPNKVTVKQEPNVGNQRGRNRRNNNRNNWNQDNSRAHQFYKDNRGYANAPSNYTNFHQNRQPMQYDHSWHTAGMIPPPLPSASTGMTAGMQMPMLQGCYPNPFALASNPMNYGYFNMHAFPPLPPPMSNSQQSQPQPSTQRNRQFSNAMNRPHLNKQ